MDRVSPDPPPAVAGRPLGRRVPIFYGWVMLPVAMIAQLATSPGQSFAIAVFNQSFTDALQLTEKQLTGAFGLGTLLASFSLPLFGTLMDRWGIRRSMSLVVLLLGCACLFASQVRGIGMLLGAFFLLRMLGQGALSLMAVNTLAMWFRRRLGTATGIMSVGCVLLMGLVPALVRGLIDSVGWRWTYVILGCAVWMMMFPLLATAFRNRPEDLGQFPDGDRGEHPTGADGARSSLEQAIDFDLAAAVRTRAYWIMCFAQSAWAMIGTALVFNIQKVFLDRGLSVSSADSALGLMFVCIASMQLFGGLLSDRVGLNWLLAISVAGMSSGVATLLLGDATWLTTGYLIFGLAQGLMGSAAGTLWARYFGRTHVGKIRGSVTTATIAGSALGPFVMGLSFDSFGSYAPSLWLFLGLYVPLGFACLFATPPQIRNPLRPELITAA